MRDVEHGHRIIDVHPKRRGVERLLAKTSTYELESLQRSGEAFVRVNITTKKLADVGQQLVGETVETMLEDKTENVLPI